MSRATQRRQSITIDELVDVIDLLKRCRFSETKWEELGLKLGLLKTTLDVIKNDHSNTYACLHECLFSWLRRNDNVDSRGGATYNSLSDALRSMNEIAVADQIDEEKCNALGPKFKSDVHSGMATRPPTRKSKSVYSKQSPYKPAQSARRSSSFTHPTQPPLVPTARQKRHSEPKQFNPQYIALNEMLPDLIDQLAGNAPVIITLNKYFLSCNIIPQDVHDAVSNTKASPKERATQLLQSLLSIIQTHHNPNHVFSLLIASLHNVKLTDAAAQLIKTLKVKGGHIDESMLTQQERTLSPQQPDLIQAEIQLHSKEKVASETVSLRQQFSSLVIKIRKCFEKLVTSNEVDVKDVAMYAEEELRGPNLKLQETSIDSIFDAIRPHYNFFSTWLLESLVNRFIPKANTLHNELAQYVNSLKKFSVSSQMKHIRSAIEYEIESASASTTATAVVITLNSRWAERTIEDLKIILKHFFEAAADRFSYKKIDYGSLVMKLFAPVKLTDSLIEAIKNKTNSMNRLGVLEIAVDTIKFHIRREDDNDFDASLQQAVEVGDSFEVSMLILLGADPNSKNKCPSAIDFTHDETTNQAAVSAVTPLPSPKTSQKPHAPQIPPKIPPQTPSQTSSQTPLKTPPVVAPQNPPTDLVTSHEVPKHDATRLAQKNELGIRDETKETLLHGMADDWTENNEEAKKREEIGVVKWDNVTVNLTKPSVGQCQEVISKLKTNQHEEIYLRASSFEILELLIPQLLKISTIKYINIESTTVTKDFILSLSFQFSSLEGLAITDSSINDEGVIALAQALKNNETITGLYLENNPDITSASAPSLAKLLRTNKTLHVLSLSDTSIDTDGAMALAESLRANKTLSTLKLDEHHENTFYYSPAVEKRLYFV